MIDRGGKRDAITLDTCLSEVLNWVLVILPQCMKYTQPCFSCFTYLKVNEYKIINLRFLLLCWWKTEALWDVSPCWQVNSYRRLEQKWCRHLQGPAAQEEPTLLELLQIILWLLDPEDKALRAFDMSVTIYQSARCHNPQDLNLQQHGREKLISHKNYNKLHDHLIQLSYLTL